MKYTDRIQQIRQQWAQERTYEREREVAERADTTLAERVAAGRALDAVEAGETGAVSGGRTLVWVEVSGERLADFRASSGSPVVLWHEEIDARSSIRGVIGRRRKDRIGVVVDDFPDERYLTGVFNVDVESPAVTFERGDTALAGLLAAKPSSDVGRIAKAAFADELSTESFPPRSFEPIDPALNEAQLEAVRRALTDEPIALVHGPPGTGKTRTLVEVVRQFVGQGKRVLVTAASNAAVDNLVERLAANRVDVVRLGHPARVSPSVEARTLDALLEQRPDYGLARGWVDEANAIRQRLFKRSDRGAASRAERRDGFREARRLMSDARRHIRGLEDAVLDQMTVVSCTLTGADSRILGDRSFDVVVVDEATQAPDPLTAIAMHRGARMVLAGDPMQLPPTILDPSLARAELGKTLFDRHAADASLLVVQHRMHAQIMRYPSDASYSGQLEAHPDVAQHQLPTADPLRPGPLVFVDTAGKGWSEETDEGSSTRNPLQAERTAREVRRLLSRGISPSDIGVISPYYAQVRLLRELLPIDGLEIDTVDGFQGREKEAIVVDLVRSNERGHIGFLSDTRRMNVALTRARRFLLVIGDSATVGGQAYYEAFLESIEEHGAWVSAWADQADELTEAKPL